MNLPPSPIWSPYNIRVHLPPQEFSKFQFKLDFNDSSFALINQSRTSRDKMIIFFNFKNIQTSIHQSNKQTKVNHCWNINHRRKKEKRFLLKYLDAKKTNPFFFLNVFQIKLIKNNKTHRVLMYVLLNFKIFKIFNFFYEKKNRKQQRYERGQGQTWNTHSEHGEKDIEKQSEIRTMMNFAIEQILTGKKERNFFKKKKKKEKMKLWKNVFFSSFWRIQKKMSREKPYCCLDVIEWWRWTNLLPKSESINFFWLDFFLQNFHQHW